jgi:hypothetical protein
LFLGHNAAFDVGAQLLGDCLRWHLCTTATFDGDFRRRRAQGV